MKKQTLVIRATAEVNHVWDRAKASSGPIAAAAKKIGLPIEDLLREYTGGKLRPTPCGDLQETRGSKVPPGFNVDPGHDNALWKRLERCAQFDETTVELMIWRAICSWVDGAEVDMIINPETGEMIGCSCEFSKGMDLEFTPAGIRAETARLAARGAGRVEYAG